MRSVHHGLAAETTEDELLELVGELGRDDDVDGILVQLPLPDQIDPDARRRARSTPARTSTGSPRRTPGCSPTARRAWCPARPPG